MELRRDTQSGCKYRCRESAERRTIPARRATLLTIAAGVRVRSVVTRRAGREDTLMRRQYHSQLVGGHTLIWDVHRLVELTRDYPVQQIPLSRIHELDECFWFGDQ